MSEVDLNSGSPNDQSRTDWDWLAKADEDEIDYSDIPPLGEAFFRQARLRLRGEATILTVNVDADVLAWFKAQPSDLEQSINDALRTYAEAHRA